MEELASLRENLEELKKDAASLKLELKAKPPPSDLKENSIRNQLAGLSNEIAALRNQIQGHANASAAATEGGVVDASPAAPTVLRLEDLIPVNELRTIPPPGDSAPKIFIGQPWAADQLNTVNKWLKSQEQPASAVRIPPMAIVGHSRSGKTRGICEVSRLVEAQNIPVLFMSLNGDTSYNVTETSNPVDSILARIAYAALKPEVKGTELLHDCGKLQFTCPMATIKEWLGKSDCVLAIDELNKFMTPTLPLTLQNLEDVVRRELAQQDVASFLKDHFLKPSGRYLMFTSHVLSTKTKLSKFMDSPSDRGTVITGLPQFSSTDEVTEMFHDELKHHTLMHGNSPALSYSCQLDPSIPDNLVDTLEIEEWPEGAAVVQSICDGSPKALPEFDTLTRFETQDQLQKRIWVPSLMIALLQSRCLTRFEGYSDLVIQALQKLDGTEVGSGKSWEAVTLCALFFRLLNAQLNSTREDPLVPNIPQGTAIQVKYPQTGDLDTFKLRYKPTEGSSRLVLVWMQDTNHAKSDIFAIYYRVDGEIDTWAYQCKTDKLPDQLAPDGVTAFCLRSADRNPNKPHVNGWTILNQAQRNAFLGPTFRALKLLDKPCGYSPEKKARACTVSSNSTQVRRLCTSRPSCGVLSGSHSSRNTLNKAPPNSLGHTMTRAFCTLVRCVPK